MLVTMVTAALAGTGDCQSVGFSDITMVQAPAVIVLGERHGTQPDLARATRVVHRLSTAAPVTLALESVNQKYQPVLDRYAAGEIDPASLPSMLEWAESWGYPWGPYERLITAALWGVNVVAAGPDLGPAPDGEQFPVPPGYINILDDAMAEHPIPPEMEPRFVRSMAWRDYSIADAAIDRWDGQGYLVIVAGRGHVEGGKGVAWQVDQRLEAPVHAFVLAWADAPCYTGDQVWRSTIFG